MEVLLTISTHVNRQDRDFPGYFANQVINNACASVAILNSVLNMGTDKLVLGSELENLKEFGTGMDFMTRGLTITNSEKVLVMTFSGDCAISVADLYALFPTRFERCTTRLLAQTRSTWISQPIRIKKRRMLSTSLLTSLSSVNYTSSTE